MMNKIKTTAVFALAFCHFDAFSWGQTGHRVTGKIAENHLSVQAQNEIYKLYPDASLAEISTFADEERSNASAFWRFTAGPWHYVTVPEGKTYGQVEPPEKGDALTALQAFAKTLKDPKASIEDKQLALHFTVHIIGDLHQPLHAGNGTDRGGNDEKVDFFWEESNLHRVWDSGMIDRQQLSYTEWSDWLGKKISKKQVTQWQQATPVDWITESTEFRDTIYPNNKELSWQYQYQHLPTVKLRLQQAGVRIAGYLNNLYQD